MMNQMMNPDFNASREAMLREVDQAGFAVVDANLYLDTHPCDAAAIDYYNQMANAYRNAAAAFEAQFGPLTASANTDAAYWSWINDPWPWEGGCYYCGFMRRDWNFRLISKSPMPRWLSL